MPEPFRSFILVYPLTHASLLLRSLSTGNSPAIGSVLALAAYTVLFFYLAVGMVKRTVRS
jgi:hypothetical protein